MADVHPFRRLSHGPPRALPKPHFLRGRGPHFGVRYLGFIMLAAMIGGATLLTRPWLDAGAVGPTVNDTALPSSPRRLAVTVVDGDSLRAGDERIRLIGLDAPEFSQTCRDGHGKEWGCGRAAKTRMAALVAHGDVACDPRGHDRYGRTLAVCSAGSVADVGEALVREGYAVDYGGYAAAEREARTARRGLWAGTFERPQDWRQRHPRRADR